MGRDGPRHSLLGVVLMKEKDLLACYAMIMGCYTSSLASLLVQYGLLVRKCQKPFSSPKSFVPSLVRGEVPKENSQSSVFDDSLLQHLKMKELTDIQCLIKGSTPWNRWIIPFIAYNLLIYSSMENRYQYQVLNIDSIEASLYLEGFFPAVRVSPVSPSWRPPAIRHMAEKNDGHDTSVGSPGCYTVGLFHWVHWRIAEQGFPVSCSSMCLGMSRAFVGFKRLIQVSGYHWSWCWLQLTYRRCSKS